MSALVTPLPSARALMPSNLPPASVHSSTKLAAASKRSLFVMAVQECIQTTGWTLNRAAEHIHALALAPDHRLHKLALELGNKGQPVGKAQIVRWVQAAEEQGKQALVDERTGRKRQEYGWELRAMHLYARPQKPSMQFVVDQLQREGFETATYNRVRGYLMSLPTDLTTHSTGRLGAQKARATARTYVQRDTEKLEVGMVYQGDGHTVDVYMAHPLTGDIWRPELTAWMDVKSRYITGWWLSESESAYTTLHALSYALLSQDHVPDSLHIDNGSGYKSKLMSDQNTGFYERWGIEVMFALPYNAKAKGQIERWFGTMERSFGKSWDSYCGADMSAEVLNKLVREVKAKRVQLPSIEQYRYALEQWIHEYHHKPHKSLDGKTPAQVWAGLQRAPLHTPEAAAFLPRETRKVNARALITLHNRSYSNRELLHYANKDVWVEYNIHNDQWIRVLDTKGNWLCDAALVEKTDYLPTSRVEELKAKRLKNQLKRQELAADETRRRAGLLLDQDPRNTALLEMNASKKKSGVETPLQSSLSHVLIPAETGSDDLLIDLTSWSPKQREEENNQF